MKLKRVNIEEVPIITKESKYLETLEEFLLSDMKAAQIEPEGTETANSLQSGFRNTAKKHKLPVAVALRKQTVYIMKEEQQEVKQG